MYLETCFWHMILHACVVHILYKVWIQGQSYFYSQFFIFEVGGQMGGWEM